MQSCRSATRSTLCGHRCWSSRDWNHSCRPILRTERPKAVQSSLHSRPLILQTQRPKAVQSSLPLEASKRTATGARLPSLRLVLRKPSLQQPALLLQGHAPKEQQRRHQEAKMEGACVVEVDLRKRQLLDLDLWMDGAHRASLTDISRLVIIMRAHTELRQVQIQMCACQTSYIILKFDACTMSFV